MTPRRPEVVTVLVDLPQFEEPALMGTLRCQSSRTGDILSFGYDDGWLKRPIAFTFDPDLALVTGLSIPVPIAPTLAFSLIPLQIDGAGSSCRNGKTCERASRDAEPDR